MKKFFSLIYQSAGIKQTLITTIGNTMATSISAIAIILISRILGPTLYGEFSVGFSIVMILGKISDGGLSSAMLKFMGGASVRNNINKYFSLTLLYRSILALVVVLFFLLFAQPLNNFFKLQYQSIYYLSVILGISVVYYEHLVTSLQALQFFFQAVLANFLQASIKLLSILIILFLNLKSLILIFISYTLAPFFPILLSKKLLPQWLKFSLTGSYQVEGRNILNMAKHSALYYVSNGLVEHLGVLFVQGYLTAFDTGLLAGATRIAMLFSLISMSLSQVLFPRVAKYKNKSDLSKYFKKAILLSFISIFGYFIFFPFIKLSLILTIGSEYISGLAILYILVAAVFIAIATIPFSALFYSFDKNWYFSLIGIIQITVAIIGNAFYVPIYGLAASAWTMLIIRLAILILTVILSFYYYWKILINNSQA